MERSEKERIVEELTERLRSSETLIVADYRGLTMTEIDDLRSKLLERGARFTVVKNTLTRRAAEAAGADALLALLEGPTAIAFLESDGDPVAVAKALGDAARDTRVLVVRGGLLEGRPVSADEVENLAKLPPAEVLRAQVLGAITAPLTSIIGLFSAPLTGLVGLIDARIGQLGESAGESAGADSPSGGDAAPGADAPDVEPEAEATETTTSETEATAGSDEEKE
jgi:large subunit ribosomal protein L10